MRIKQAEACRHAPLLLCIVECIRALGSCMANAFKAAPAGDGVFLANSFS